MAKAQIEIVLSEEARALMETLTMAAAKVEPWKIRSPQGERFAFIDDANQEHWVEPGHITDARERGGYRQLYVEKRES